jgi:hypothetical protein
MKRTWLAGLLVSTATTPLFAQGGETSPPQAGAGSFAAPNGPLGAGLSLSPEQKGRAYAELAFTRAADSESQGGATASSHMTGLSWILGGGYKVMPNLELELMLPMGWGEVGFEASQGAFSISDSNSGFAVGNLHLGANYLIGRDRWRLKVGGAVQYAPWNHNPETETIYALFLGNAARSIQDGGLWASEVLSIVAPARFEYGNKLVLGGDAALGLHIPTNGADVEMSIQIDPSLGYFVTDTTLIGARLPFVWIPTDSGDYATQLAFEPYARFDIDPGFIATRFTLNIDDPLGFSFDGGKFWAIHVGGGGHF